MKRIHFFMAVLFLFAVSCREKYNIQPKPSDLSVLVVEGTLKAGTEQTIIKLSKSTQVNNPGGVLPVSHAQVTVESNIGTAMSLVETGSTGNYVGTLGLDVTKEYRLRIITNDGKEYLSDYVPVKESKDIDSLNWKWENEGVMIYANTHDATNNSKYYKWEYDETWEIVSPYYSILKLVDTTIQYRDLTTEDVSHCWKTGKSTSIILGSSAQLTSDVISQAPVCFLPKNTEKIGTRYSILVKQMVLTKPAYDYFEQMKKNTEQLGSIFDPLPSELKGNIQCLTNSAEQVIGYVTAASTKEKRIFIAQNQVPGWIYSYTGCISIYVKNVRDSLKKYIPQYWPYDEDRMNPFGPPNGYYVAAPPCTDCTLRGGSNVKPSYW